MNDLQGRPASGYWSYEPDLKTPHGARAYLRRAESEPDFKSRMNDVPANVLTDAQVKTIRAEVAAREK